MKEQEIRPSLYMVATPIGNLEDISSRALRILGEVDWIAAEDTRHSLKLLNEFGIKKPLKILHEHSTDQKIAELVALLKSGESGAYISDAGTPAISDPGAKLVKAAQEEGVLISPIPGASAVVALLSVSGFLSSSFRFHGFFPREKKDKEEAWNLLLREGSIHVFYESPFRIKETLNFLKEKSAEVRVVLGRELTKKFESLYVGSLHEVWKEIDAMSEVKGEIVFALELPEPSTRKRMLEQKSPQDLVGDFQKMAALGANQKLLLALAESHGIKRGEVYDLILEILNKKGGQS